MPLFLFNKNEDYFFLFTAALKAAPAVKRGTVAAAILRASPVRGFLPVRAARLAAGIVEDGRVIAAYSNDELLLNKDKIRDPDLIYPGQIFTMPKGE